jgi:oligoribonuclease NrnB/cAMP/cGMP phosphodiesterase (DHH superfamily)
MNINLDLTQVVVGVIISLLSLFTAFVNKFVNAKANELKQSNKHTELNKYIDLADKLIVDTVNMLNQTIVADLKTKAEDGKLTEEEKNEILQTAIGNVYSLLADDGKKVLSTAYSDVPEYIRTQIEKVIAQSKK